MSDQPEKPWKISAQTRAAWKFYEELQEHANHCAECREALDARSGYYCPTGGGLVDQFYNPEL
jgi:hypothetical protein